MLERSGSVWTALAHIITAVIGSGVLSLAWSMSRLGWIAGPLTMLAFASVTLTSAFLLCNCFHSPDLDGQMHRNGSYLDAVGSILGTQSPSYVYIISKYLHQLACQSLVLFLIVEYKIV